MANKSYLFVSDHDGICPAWVDTVPDIAEKVLAEDVYCVPLLWLAMFRPADLTTTVFPPDEDDEDEGDVEVTAPLAPKDRALAQLSAAVPVLNRIFAGQRPLDEHAALLAEGVAQAPGRFVTIDLYEIAVLEDPEAYHRLLRAGLAALDPLAGDDERAGTEESVAVATARDQLVDLAQLRSGRPFPPARLLFDQADATDDDYWNFTRLLGSSYLRPVPWEPAH